MMEDSTRDFHHPFHPYDIQSQLMTAIYDCISDGKVGIFESPTGTGKSLSLICSTLSWLRDEQKIALDRQASVEESNEEPTWILEQARKQKTEQLLHRRLELESRLAKIREKESRLRLQYEKGEPLRKRAKVNHGNSASELGDEDQFVLDDYESENEAKASTAVRADRDGLSAASLDLMRKLGEPCGPAKDDPDLETADELKIFFCSRTHSQLTQFINELRRVRIPEILGFRDGKECLAGNVQQESNIRHLPLGSRRNLCINPSVANAGNTAAVNERCLDLQQSSTPQEKKCSFLPTKQNEVLVNEFRDHTLARIRDIEDLGALGKKIGICPYYASRASIKPSEIVTLPYQLLLQKSAREALGISLKGHVVVIDEAHNLMDAITNIHSITITQSQLHRCRTQLRYYLQKFRNKLKGKNRVYITQTVRLIDSISDCLDRLVSQSSSVEVLVTVGDMMSGKGVDQINLYKLVRYLAESKLARKVEGYNEYVARQALSGQGNPMDTTPVLTHIQGFLQALMNPAAEGRFFFERDESSYPSFKYLLLDPTFHFKEVVEDARAVVLAGGTMSPMNDYAQHLLRYVATERLKTWSCGHIVPKDNLFVRSVSRTQDGVDLDFSFTKRNSVPLINGLGCCLVQLAATVPDGLVVFFPSYAYLDQVSGQWQQTRSGSENIWTRLEKRKIVFKESKGASSIEATLQEYSKAIDEGKGAILLSVIGGKMSEGINFSDRLGRGVAVVGLPFPNLHSAQWKAKLDYIEQSTMDRGGSSAEGKAAGRDFYENACMRAVNQSIGRAIRHQRDFASILLLDRRYSTSRIANKLPGWIKQGFHESKAAASFPEIIQGLQAFFDA
ncbi:MAG: hypothetical protein L6R42_004722 [Xanthoria sp. 1 TBL-2021]|nr:MAG: hypothetical protein L6R42_004722 [Xanthoria sp. 1 TBL-2021]